MSCRPSKRKRAIQGSAAAWMVRLTEPWERDRREMVRSLLVTTQASSVSRLRSKSAGRGGGGEADAAAGTHRIERDLDQAGGIAIEDPQRVAAAGEAHGDGGVTGADAPRNGQQAGFDLVDGAIGGGKDVGLGGFGAGEHVGRSGVEGDLLARVEAGEIDHADGASVPIGDEAVPEEALGFAPGAGRGGSGGEEQGAPRNRGTVHSDILSHWEGMRGSCYAVKSPAIPKPERWPSG